MTTRRDFLLHSAAGAAALAAGPLATTRAGAADPIVRPTPADPAATPPGIKSSGMKLSLAAYSFRSLLPVNGTADDLAKAGMTLSGFVEYCASLGLDGAELTGYYFPKVVQETPLRRTPDAAVDAATRQARIDEATDYLNGLKNRAFRLGIEVSGTAIGNDFCVAEGPAWVGQINLCKDWIDIAAAVGAPVIRIFAGKVPAGESEEVALTRCVTAINECLVYAARRGVFLALENHGGITANPATMLRIVKQVKPSPWFGVNFDSGNFKTDDPYRDMAAIAPYALNVQIKASVSPSGVREPANLPRIIDLLKTAGYRGYVVLEYEEPEDPKVAIPPLVAEIRKLIQA